MGGYDYCWADDGWPGPGWYWCGYAYRPGLGWGGGSAGTTCAGSFAIATISAANAGSFGVS